MRKYSGLDIYLYKSFNTTPMLDTDEEHNALLRGEQRNTEAAANHLNH
ncbi:hypothetical protein VCHA55P509_90164 [Vibrio chagasii]|nr:hypothetical protein VCHA55P509_90164 [Vibrio chagasii]